MRVTIGSYRLDYDLTPNASPGLSPKDGGRGLYMDLNFMADDFCLYPSDQITFHVKGTISTSAPADDLKIGFIQSIGSMDARAVYDNGSTFSRRFASFPVKDGSGDPWYRDEDGEIYEHDRGAVTDHPFEIQTSDLPKFCFPKTLPSHHDSPASAATAAETFHTWLAAETGGKLYFLYEVEWTYKASWRKGGDAEGGLNVVSHGEVGDPTTQPREAVLTGKPANLSEQQTIS